MPEYRRVPPRNNAPRHGFGATLLWFAGIVLFGAVLGLMFGHHLPTGLRKGLRDVGDGAGRAVSSAFASPPPAAAPAPHYADYESAPDGYAAPARPAYADGGDYAHAPVAYYASSATWRPGESGTAEPPAARLARTPAPVAEPVRRAPVEPAEYGAPASDVAVTRIPASAPARTGAAPLRSDPVVVRTAPAAAPLPPATAVRPNERLAVAPAAAAHPADATPLSASRMTILEKRSGQPGLTKHTVAIRPDRTVAPETPVRWRTVLRVVDGDTLVLDGEEKVRLLGIDAPESSMNDKLRADAERARTDPETIRLAGVRAAAHLRRLIGHQAVRLTVDRNLNDKYGRTLAYVWLADGRMANREMVRAGQAVAYRPEDFRYRAEFTALEREASRRGLGIHAARPPAATASAR